MQNKGYSYLCLKDLYKIFKAGAVYVDALYSDGVFPIIFLNTFTK